MSDALLRLGLIDDEDILLDAAGLTLARIDRPDADLEPPMVLLDAISERLAMLGGDAVTPRSQAALLARVIVGEFGFQGDAETYDDPANGDLLRVLERRRGLPVALAVIYVALARRCGWAADALNTPGHVLVRVGGGIAPVLLDPFSGEIVGRDRLAALLAGMLGPDAAPVAEHLAPMANRAVLVRLLLNGAIRSEAGGDGARALVLFRRMTAIAPGDANAWWQRARLELGDGDVAGARASLSAMLEITRDPDVRLRVAAVLEGLADAAR